jgi:hypothetical protein
LFSAPPSFASVSGSDGPGIKKRKIPEEINLAFGRFHLEIAYLRSGRIDAAFIPAIDDFHYLPATFPERERMGAFIDPIATVAHDLDRFISHGALAE